jgi:O-antigen/teichoic acid export membrane protein
MFLSSNVANAGNLVFNMLFGRWMGPELFADLATLLTLKLSLLAVLNAVQMAVSQVVSGRPAGFGAAGLLWLNRVGFVGMAVALPFLVPPALTGALGDALGLGSASALVLLLLALPVTVPLCICRGIAVGRMDVARIVWSANIEMAVRLGGSVVLWHLGAGIEGVALAIAASLVAGWLPVSGALAATPAGQGRRMEARDAGVVRPVLLLALPFAVLQAAQVLHLDGDILVANAVLTSGEVGSVAVLSLVQRVQFFACFGLAAVLLPAVTAAALTGGSGLREAAPVAALFGLVSVATLVLLGLAPLEVITFLVGPAYADAAPSLATAGLCAVLFTLSYLCATYLAALGDRRGIWLMALFVPLQISTFVLLSLREAGMTLGQMMLAKLFWQAGLSLALLLLIFWRSRARTAACAA